MTTNPSVEFQVAPASLDYAVSVLLRKVSDRWMAIAHCPDRPYVGLGASAREALASAFMPLGPRNTAILMADPALFGASLQVLPA